MKKIIPLLLTITLAFVSCQVEPLGDEGLNAVEGKASSSNEDCYVNLTPTLPTLVDVCTTVKPGTESYFLVDIASGDLAGSDIPAWCVDVDKSLGAPECFEANVYSSYGSFPTGNFDKPGNFDLVNWILNQDFISLGYTFGHIQWAIWELLENDNCQSCTYLTNPTGNWADPADVVKGQEIVDAAIAAGDGFEPVAGQNLAIILIPTDGTTQSIIIPYPLECEPEPSCETTFGKAQTEGEDGTSTCFIDLEDPYKFNRWGWSVELPGEGTYTFDIWGGAGQCDTSKGTLVGTAEVNYSGGTVNVVYTLNDGFVQNEVHTYAGEDPVATNEKNGKPTVAPGQYTIGTGLSGPIYVILHSVICGDYDED